MRNVLITAFFAYSLLLICGCETFKDTEEKKVPQAQTENKNDIPVPPAPVEDKTVRLETDVNSMRETILKQEESAAVLRREIEKLDAENKKIIDEILIIKKEIYEEKKIREETLEKLSSRLTQESQRKEETKPQRYVLPDPPPDLKGDFYIYIVQPGTNLHSISKAYKVSIDEIKKANNLKNDTIYAGQKLYIPKK